MSKRFGRNQKRRMREQEAALHEALARDGALLAHVSEQKRELEEVLGRARRILGDHVALPPELRGDHPHPLGGDFDIPIPERLTPLSPSAAMPAIEPMSLRIARMHHLLSWIEDGDHQHDPSAIHLRVRLDSGEVAYVISRKAIHSLSAAELQRTIFPQIAMELAGHLARGLKGGWR